MTTRSLRIIDDAASTESRYALPPATSTKGPAKTEQDAMQPPDADKQALPPRPKPRGSGRKRFPIVLTLPEDARSHVDQLKQLLIPLAPGSDGKPRSLHLQDLADVKLTTGPPMLREEGGQLVGTVYVDLEPQADLSRYVETAKETVERARTDGRVHVAKGAYLRWTGQFELLAEMKARMAVLVPLALLLIALLLYRNSAT